jgi:hypothetical protein
MLQTTFYLVTSRLWTDEENCYTPKAKALEEQPSSGLALPHTIYADVCDSSICVWLLGLNASRGSRRRLTLCLDPYNLVTESDYTPTGYESVTDAGLATWPGFRRLYH